MNIMIPFNKWSLEKIKEGKKKCTCRRKPYGKIGDTFEVDGTLYELTDVMQGRLSDVAEYWYEFEGCNSPDEFKHIWKLIHRKMGYVPDMVVYLHCFEIKNQEG